VGVLRVARQLWSWDVPLQATIDARAALAGVNLTGRSSERDRIVTDAEIDKIVKHFDSVKSGIPYADLVRFAIGSAMRLGEICRLRWEDFDEVNRVILIRDRKDPKRKIGNHQLVPLLNRTGFDAYEILKRQPRNGPRVFALDGKTVSSMFPRHMRRLGIRDCHFHDLRHTAVSKLFASGLTVPQVALISGHKSWEQLRRYTHISAADLHNHPPASPPASSPALRLVA
jgi:integrase